jgi:hypothetical protein
MDHLRSVLSKDTDTEKILTREYSEKLINFIDQSAELLFY